MKKIILAITILTLTGISFSIQGQDNKLFQARVIEKTMMNAAKWQFKHPKHELYDWTNGAFYAGVSAAYKVTGSKKLYKEMIRMGEANEWEAGPRLHHADDYAICQTYIDLYRIDGDKAKIKPFKNTMDDLVLNPFPAELPLRPITWWWCDALFMGPPAIVKLGTALNDDSFLKLNDSLYKECFDLLFDQEEHLFARDIRYKADQEKKRREANGEKIFWSRGNGWVMGGLALILQDLPGDYENRVFYEELFSKMAERIASLQQEDGLWRASLLDPESYPGGEASGSGFYCFALAWGINDGLLDKVNYLPIVKKAWLGLNRLIQDDGHVGWVQPVGADPRKNFNANNWEVYGTGAFLLAGSEILKLEI